MLYNDLGDFSIRQGCYLEVQERIADHYMVIGALEAVDHPGMFRHLRERW